MRPSNALICLAIPLLAIVTGIMAASKDYVLNIKINGNVDAYFADLQKNISLANGSTGKDNAFIRRITIGDGFVGARVNMSDTLYAKSLKDSRVVNLGLNRNGSLAATIVSCGVTGMKCHVDAPWGLASLNTYKNESLPQDYQKNFTYLTRHDGKDVNVYVLDSGINPNSTEFGSRLSIGPNFSTDKVSDDLNGHGTSMASIIGSQTFGVANGVNITSIKIFNQWGDSTHSAAMEAFQWVWEDRVTTPSKYKRSLINLSAIFERGETFDEAINAYYLQKQIDTPTDNDGRNLLVLSAGNTGGDACNYSPAYEARTMVVTAHDQNKEIPSWANNGGNCTFYAAPGHRIISFNQRYELSSGYGTSQAAAFASGVLASLLSDALLMNQESGDDYPYFLMPDLFIYDNGPMDMKDALTKKASRYSRFVLPSDETLFRNTGSATPIPGSRLEGKCGGKPAKTCKWPWQ